MFAVVRTGGKQYRVAPGDKIVVEKMDGNAGDRVTLGDVLLAGDGSDLKSTDGLKVAAEIIAQAKGEKVTVFKKKRRHNYRRKKGHRQQHTILRIVAIGDHKAEAKPKSAKSEASPAKPEAQAKSETSTKDEAPKKAEASAKADAPKKAAAATAEEPNAGKPKAEKKAAPAKAGKTAPAKAEKTSTKNAAPAKGAAKKSTKSKK